MPECVGRQKNYAFHSIKGKKCHFWTAKRDAVPTVFDLFNQSLASTNFYLSDSTSHPFKHQKSDFVSNCYRFALIIVVEMETQRYFGLGLLKHSGLKQFLYKSSGWKDLPAKQGTRNWPSWCQLSAGSTRELCPIAYALQRAWRIAKTLDHSLFSSLILHSPQLSFYSFCCEAVRTSLEKPAHGLVGVQVSQKWNSMPQMVLSNSAFL